jgi:hypothetical protein
MASPQSDIVRFQPNVPQLCSLKFAGPKVIQTRMGERAMYSLKDGRVMFLEPKVAESIAMLSLHAGEEFYVAKRISKDRGEYWDVWVAPDMESLKPGGGPASPESQPPQAALQQFTQSLGSSPSIPESILDDAKAKLTAYHELCAWAKANLEGVTRNEVRAILMNSMISAERKYR